MDVRDAPFPKGFRLEEDATVLEGTALEAAVAAGTRALLAAGLQRHEPVVLHARETLGSILALLALRRSGATTVLVHPQWSSEEREAVVRRTGARLVVDGSRLPTDAGQWTLPLLTGTPRALPAQYVLFTSGTEGSPKGVLLGEGAFRAHAHAVTQRLGLVSSDRWLLSLSLAHVGGLALLLRALWIGNAVVVPNDVRDIPGEVGRGAITHLSLVPTQFARWTREAPRPPAGLRCVLLGGGPAPEGLVADARRAGWPLRVTYGLTEASSQVATQEADDPTPSPGRPLPGVTVTIEDADGRPAAPGASGRVLVRGPTVALGYLDDAAATGATFRGGWLRTQDLGRIDPDGRVWPLGRLDDVIITGGENVDPAEVEAVLETHPSVEQACVVGVPDPEWGQAVVAVLVAHAAARIDAEALRAHCAASLARFKVPKRFETAQHLPRTVGGKLRRGAVRATINPR